MESILYEFPLNERIRLFMRLEKLFQQIDYFVAGTGVWDCRAVVASLIQMSAMLGRHDLKTELLKEVDRHHQALSKLTGNPHVDELKVLEILSELEEIASSLRGTAGKVGQPLMEIDLFQAVSQRGSAPGGTCSFDLPAFHYWLEQDDSKRKEDLTRWLQPLNTVKSAIHVLMGCLRNSASATCEIARRGFYQRVLDHHLPVQLLRVVVDRRYPCFAEISGGRHRFTVRFMLHAIDPRPAPFQDDVEFRLSCCVL